MTTTYWCELAWLGDLGGAVEQSVTLTVDGDRITGVEAGTTAAADAVSGAFARTSVGYQLLVPGPFAA